MLYGGRFAKLLTSERETAIPTKQWKVACIHFLFARKSH